MSRHRACIPRWRRRCVASGGNRSRRHLRGPLAQRRRNTSSWWSMAIRSPPTTSSSAPSSTALDPQAAGAPGGHRRADQREAQGPGREPLQARDRRQRGRTAYAEMAKRMRPRAAAHPTLAQGGVDAGTLKARIRADMGWQQIVRGKFQSSFQFREKDILAAIETRKKDDKDKAEREGHRLRIRAAADPVHRAEGLAATAIDARRKEAEALRTRFQDCEHGLPLRPRAAGRRGARADHQELRRSRAGPARDPRQDRARPS